MTDEQETTETTEVVDQQQLYKWRHRAKRGGTLAAEIQTELDNLKDCLEHVRATAAGYKLLGPMNGSMMILESVIRNLESSIAKFHGM